MAWACLLLVAGAAQAAPVQVAIGSGSATPGGAVTIGVSLDPSCAAYGWSCRSRRHRRARLAAARC